MNLEYSNVVENTPRRSGRERQRNVRLSELNSDELQNDKHDGSERKRKQRNRESETRKELRRKHDQEAHASTRASQTIDQRTERQQRDQEAHASTRASETIDQTMERQQRDRQHRHEMRNIQVPSYQSGRPTDSELENFESDPLSAQLKFANSSGFDIMYQAIGTLQERRGYLLERLENVSEEDISNRISAFNTKMNPALAIEACAACGIQVLGETLEKIPLNECVELKQCMLS